MRLPRMDTAEGWEEIVLWILAVIGVVLIVLLLTGNL